MFHRKIPAWKEREEGEGRRKGGGPAITAFELFHPLGGFAKLQPIITHKKREGKSFFFPPELFQ